MLLSSPNSLQRRHCPEQADDDRQQRRDRYRPALVEAHEKEISEDDGQAEDRAGLARRRFLLERRAGPLVGIAVRAGSAVASASIAAIACPDE